METPVYRKLAVNVEVNTAMWQSLIHLAMTADPKQTAALLRIGIDERHFRDAQATARNNLATLLNATTIVVVPPTE